MPNKNPFVFTLGFNKSNPSHIRVVEILNETENKAQLIACAILQYYGEADSSAKTEIDLETVKTIVAALVKQEIQKAMESIGTTAIVFPEKEVDEVVVDLTDETEAMPQNKELAKHVLDAMSAFRKM